MMNPNRDEFVQDNPLAAANTPGPTAESLTNANYAAGDEWKQPSATPLERTESFVRENPVPIIVTALVLGLAAGWALRHTTREEKKVEAKTPLGDFSWSFLTLPFLWPFFKSMREKAGESVEALSDSVRAGAKRARKIDMSDYTKPLRKRWRNWTS
jgi:hypothetical protein